VKNSNGSRTLDDLHSHTELETSMMWLLYVCYILFLTAAHLAAGAAAIAAAAAA
jgi:hypothetical protein